MPPAACRLPPVYCLDGGTGCRLGVRGGGEGGTPVLHVDGVRQPQQHCSDINNLQRSQNIYKYYYTRAHVTRIAYTQIERLIIILYFMISFQGLRVRVRVRVRIRVRIRIRIRVRVRVRIRVRVRVGMLVMLFFPMPLYRLLFSRPLSWMFTGPRLTGRSSAFLYLVM